MKRNTNEWLDRKVADWVSKGWISEESQQKIRKSYGRDEQRNPLLTTLPLYALLAVIGLAAAGGAIAMGVAVGKSTEGIARQPEAESKIRTTLMLGLVFIETAIIYALLVVILIIFVL